MELLRKNLDLPTITLLNVCKVFPVIVSIPAGVGIGYCSCVVCVPRPGVCSVPAHWKWVPLSPLAAIERGHRRSPAAPWSAASVVASSWLCPTLQVTEDSTWLPPHRGTHSHNPAFAPTNYLLIRSLFFNTGQTYFSLSLLVSNVNCWRCYDPTYLAFLTVLDHFEGNFVYI